MAIDTPGKTKVRNVFRLKGVSEDLIDYILELRESEDLEETKYFHMNCIIHESIHFNLPDKSIREYGSEEQLFLDNYKPFIPINKDLHQSIVWCIDTRSMSKNDIFTRNRYLTQIEILQVYGLIQTSFQGRVFDSSLKDKLRLMKNPPFSLITDTFDDFIYFQNPIIIDVSGKPIYF